MIFFLVLIIAFAPKTTIVEQIHLRSSGTGGVDCVLLNTHKCETLGMCLSDGLAESGNLSFLVLFLASIHLIKH